MAANATDGTTMNQGSGGDTIATEDMPVGTPRGDQNLPLTDYKLGRSKIAVGPYDQDLGDATSDRPLPVESRAQRQLAELAFVRQIDQQRTAFATRSRELVSPLYWNRGER